MNKELELYSAFGVNALAQMIIAAPTLISNSLVLLVF